MARSLSSRSRFPQPSHHGPRRAVSLALLALAALLAVGPAGGGESRNEDRPRGPGASRGPREPADSPAGETARPEPPIGQVGNLETSHLGPLVAPDHVVVRFADDLAGWQRRQLAAAAGATTFKVAPTGRLTRLGVAAGDRPGDLVERLRGLTGVLSAELDPLARGLGRQLKAAPADPEFARQWSLARIRLAEALDRNPQRGEGVIVAVIDSGVAFGDGAAFPVRRGLDLAGVRFLPGADLVDGGLPYDRGTRLGTSGSRTFGHGTYVASLIAAGTDNGIAGAGVAPRVTILPLRVIGTDNFALFSDVAEAIDLAVASGARVINLSLGGPQPASFLEQAIERARRAGVVLVAAAGNEAAAASFDGDVLYPARYPAVIAVGASDFDDRPAAYSNHGPGLDLMAPAGGDLDRMPRPELRDAALAPSFVYDGATGTANYGLFWSTGTSFAAPQVAGAAALLLSLGVRDADAVRALLEETAHDLGERGLDATSGQGLLDLLAAHQGLGFGS